MELTTIEDKIQMILRQTNYTQEEARIKLLQFNEDPLIVIRDFLGITEKKNLTPVFSVNQEIYRQLRFKLDNSMREYQAKKGSEIEKK